MIPEPCPRCGWQYEEEVLADARLGRVQRVAALLAAADERRRQPAVDDDLDVLRARLAERPYPVGADEFGRCVACLYSAGHALDCPNRPDADQAAVNDHAVTGGSTPESIKPPTHSDPSASAS